MLRTSVAACTLLMALAPLGSPQEEKLADITLKAVKYKELGKLVRAQKGKVVVVDFWGLT
ncbi:MAG: hypothetical protein AB7K24_34830 [Gemmataceae bacterium]